MTFKVYVQSEPYGEDHFDDSTKSRSLDRLRRLLDEVIESCRRDGIEREVGIRVTREEN